MWGGIDSGTFQDCATYALPAFFAVDRGTAADMIEPQSDSRQSSRRVMIDQRTGWDRRAGIDRRRGPRRVQVMPVVVERRIRVDRRVALRRGGKDRRSGVERRRVPDRRSSAWNALEGS